MAMAEKPVQKSMVDVPAEYEITKNC